MVSISISVVHSDRLWDNSVGIRTIWNKFWAYTIFEFKDLFLAPSVNRP